MRLFYTCYTIFATPIALCAMHSPKSSIGVAKIHTIFATPIARFAMHSPKSTIGVTKIQGRDATVL